MLVITAIRRPCHKNHCEFGAELTTQAISCLNKNKKKENVNKKQKQRIRREGGIRGHQTLCTG